MLSCEYPRIVILTVIMGKSMLIKVNMFYTWKIGKKFYLKYTPMLRSCHIFAVDINLNVFLLSRILMVKLSPCF